MPIRCNSEMCASNPARLVLRRSFMRALLACVVVCAAASGALADQLRMADGTSIEVEEAWEDAQGIWYRRSGVVHLVSRARVRSIERTPREAEAGTVASKVASEVVPVQTTGGDAVARPETEQDIWIYLAGGGKMEVDEANETSEGVWYRRGNLSSFIARERVERVERERGVAEIVAPEVAATRAHRERRWSTGNKNIDLLIKQNGTRYGVDPYLIFCVMVQESQFNLRAVSPKGARGLMQLMPGTAARFGVRKIHDPAQNIAGGTRYLKELLVRFRGRVDLVLAGYNAGEGAVLKYGHRVPPYRETRNYVRRISARYQGSQ